MQPLYQAEREQVQVQVPVEQVPVRLLPFL
jgi:hypothetical protein